MGAIVLIVFRESLEAALIIGILLAYIRRTGLDRIVSALWAGAIAAIAASIGTAFLFLAVFGGFEGRAEQLFEGSVMLAGAILVTVLILWIDHADIRASLEEKIAMRTDIGGWRSIALLAFVSVFREGVETVIFIGASLRASGLAGVIAALAGMTAAVAIGFLVYSVGSRIGLRRFFAATNILLILFAAGLVGRSAGEFGEAGVLPPVVEQLWDLNPPLVDASFPAMHEKGAIGSFLGSLFGYSATPSLSMAIAYGLYLCIVAAIILFSRRGRRNRTRPPDGRSASA
ncbi:MAG: high-affinity iron transporter [Spirochaetae bacterium HGW-Spirochaetae-7]|jgi:high-affinity iron transporter|nr:MAG: high-affinity iron transporter [Spirochaetae bacterium HGW-Spirochaetae-7]